MEEILKRVPMEPRRVVLTVRKIDMLLFLASACVVMLVVVAAFVYQGFEKISQRTAAATWKTPTRMEINEAVVRLILAGRSSEVYNFYAFEVGDPLKASLYVEAAIEGDGTHPAPIDLIMALGYWEGGHALGKIDGPNQNGSYDVRPLGLNTYTYKRYSLADLQREEVNIPFGVTHLVNDKIKWGISWESALSAYNKGSPEGLDQRQVDYVAAVLRHEYEIDRRFAARFPEMF